MAVYTPVTLAQAKPLIQKLGLGHVVALKACSGGIENTNYFVTTELNGQQQEHVLTLFERLSAEQLPFYLQLMGHLAHKGIPVPNPVADAKGQVLHKLKDKPAALVNKLSGKNQMQPQPVHCAAVGAMLARMHLAGQDYPAQQPNLRGIDWWRETVPVVMPFLATAQVDLLRSEMAYQEHIAVQPAYLGLPRGPIHADLFRDNVMFDGDALTGFFDFYFAGVDTWLFDLAVCLNDWCINHDQGTHHPEQAAAMMDAYQSIRPLTGNERTMLPAMLRAAALRFWISRLWDFYLPREASVLKAHDPAHFERVLHHRAVQPFSLTNMNLHLTT
jgi:homoserine kinase type II